MSKLSFAAALLLGKCARFGLKLLGKSASYLPGGIALRICPDFLKYIAAPQVLVCVTGTNGKTTLTNLIADALEQAGVPVLSNRAGSNTVEGVAGALMNGVSCANKCRYNVAVLEVDERSSLLVYKHVKPTHLVCTNLFRDSMRRNANTDYIAGILNAAIPDETILVLNADDPISSRLKPFNGRIYFGVAPLPDEEQERDCMIVDMRICPVCGSRLVYDFQRYHHIGRLHCPDCCYKSPDAQYLVKSVDYLAGTLTAATHRGDVTLRLVNKNMYNIYNEIAAVALLQQLGMRPARIAGAMEHACVNAVRQSDTRAGSIDIVCHVAKGQNPVAVSRALSFVRTDSGRKVVYLTVDDVFDEKETSENISWIYETDFENLADDSVLRIYIAGVRAPDYRLRLLLAGVPEERIITLDGHRDILNVLDLTGADKLFIMYDLYRYKEGMSIRDGVIKRIGKGMVKGA